MMTPQDAIAILEDMDRQILSGKKPSTPKQIADVIRQLQRIETKCIYCTNCGSLAGVGIVDVVGRQG